MKDQKYILNVVDEKIAYEKSHKHNHLKKKLAKRNVHQLKSDNNVKRVVFFFSNHKAM